ncbi:MAG: metallophosphoesterase [Candidatus Competibacteraceae bacterium]|nr:metallophosphoesterase [Candidatus Competibacteraceae bacterium]MCB1821260.1 metallophosphoesterase [Candidatus Competibacteraceae bacterium]
MRILHTADLHLDSPLRGLDRYEGAPVDDIRGATRRAFENLLVVALRERVDLVVIAGDLYDGDWLDHNTGLFFTKGVMQLAEEGIPVAIVRGNHDAASRLTKTLRLPRNVHLFADARPETRVFDDIGIAVHGQSFAAAVVSDDLAAGYPPPVASCFNLGLLHSSLNGRPGHAPYAPTQLDVLRNKGYGYWALGHIHAAEIVCRDPWVVYPGNTQGRHIRETGAKGCTLVTIEDHDIAHQFIALDVMRWTSLSLEIDALPDLEALLDRVKQHLQRQLTAAEDRALAVRIQIRGSGPLHGRLAAQPEVVTQEIRNVAIEATNARTWIEKVELRTRPLLDLDQLAKRDDPVGMLLRELRALAAHPGLLRDVAAEALGELLQKLPVELRQGEDALRLDDADALIECLAEVEADLLARLSGEEGVR